MKSGGRWRGVTWSACSVLALLGFLLASLAMAVKLQFNFEWALLMAVVAILGITQLVRWFRKRDS